MAIEKGLYAAPVGLDELYGVDGENSPDLEITIEDPESVEIGIGGQPILSIEKGEDDEDFNENLAEELDEGIELTKVAAPKHGDDGANNKSVVAFNSGAAGMEGAPVKATGTEAKGRPAPSTQAVSSDKFQNEPATGSKKLSPATKPVTTQAAGVNTKTPFPKG